MHIANARNMTTTAEGVETEQQMDLLRALGCTEMRATRSVGKAGSEIRRLYLTHPSAESPPFIPNWRILSELSASARAGIGRYLSVAI